MMLSDIKDGIKTSATYDFFSRIFRFFKMYKVMSICLATFLVSVSIIASPIIQMITNDLYNDNQNGATDTKTTEYTEPVVVYVSGEVKNPGVYNFTTDDRVIDAIDKAGGFTDNAYKDDINLAQKLYDEQHICVLSKSEHESKGSSGKTSGNSAKIFRGTININTATAQELQQLPGIGEKTAQSIIEYRNQVGGFKDISDIMSVKGIGYSLFSKIRNNLTY